MPFSSLRRVTDVDEFRSYLRPVRNETLVTTGGPFSATMARGDFRNLWMQSTKESATRLTYSAVSRNRTGFSFLTQPGPGIIFCGIETEPNDIVAADSNRDFVMRLNAAHWGGLSLPDSYLADYGPMFFGNAAPPRWPVSPALNAIATLRKLHAKAMYLTEHEPDMIVLEEPSRGLEQAIVQALLMCFVTPATVSNNIKRQQHQIIMRRFRTYIEERGTQPVYIPEVCAAIKVPHRTLGLCCQEYLGMGPKEYLMLRRMHMTRRGLREADGARTTVAEVAMQFGFWELGRFAVKYKALFGESPSVTLKRFPTTNDHPGDVLSVHTMSIGTQTGL